MNEGRNVSILKTVLGGLFLALCMVLPMIGGNIQQILNKVSPMHFPVMLCGFVCGWQYGLIVGFIAPILRGVIFGMPPLVPTGVAMAFELAVYGAVTGILNALLPKKNQCIYITLVVAMVLGRVVWGLVSVPLYGMTGKTFTVMIFIMNGFINAIPAIILQLLIIPVIVMALRRAKLIR